jgi:hypothetical protein
MEGHNGAEPQLLEPTLGAAADQTSVMNPILQVETQVVPPLPTEANGKPAGATTAAGLASEAQHGSKRSVHSADDDKTDAAEHDAKRARALDNGNGSSSSRISSMTDFVSPNGHVEGQQGADPLGADMQVDAATAGHAQEMSGKQHPHKHGHKHHKKVRTRVECKAPYGCNN